MDVAPRDLQLWIHHDDDVEVFINGILAYRRSGWTSNYEPRKILPDGLKAIRAGKNTIAIHCHQHHGGQFIDLGFVTVSDPE